MFRSFAVLPAAGTSARMGAPKLLLPYAGTLLIHRVLAAWTASRVTRVVVVVRPDDAQLAEACRGSDVDLVVPPFAPPDMKASVRCSLAHIAAVYHPSPSDAWLLAPADMPRLTIGAINRVLAAYDPHEPAATYPLRQGERGHPVAFPWSWAAEVDGLGPREGVNALLARGPVREVPSCCAGVLGDLDTPRDYAELLATEPNAARICGTDRAPGGEWP